MSVPRALSGVMFGVAGLSAFGAVDSIGVSKLTELSPKARSYARWSAAAGGSAAVTFALAGATIATRGRHIALTAATGVSLLVSLATSIGGCRLLFAPGT